MASWEFYQQKESGAGITFPLWWICGLNNVNGASGFATFTADQSMSIWAVPFDQMRAVTVSKMMIFLKTRAPQDGAKCRLGIYQNDSSTNNAPKNLILDAGEITIDTTVNTGVKTLMANQNLQANTRYWVVLHPNQLAAAAELSGLEAKMMIFWGPLIITSISAPSPGFATQLRSTAHFPIHFPHWTPMSIRVYSTCQQLL